LLVRLPSAAGEDEHGLNGIRSLLLLLDYARYCTLQCRR
jgi:hypothetical protein